jgi:hypothetical protein
VRILRFPHASKQAATATTSTFPEHGEDKFIHAKPFSHILLLIPVTTFGIYIIIIYYLGEPSMLISVEVTCYLKYMSEAR